MRRLALAAGTIALTAAALAPAAQQETPSGGPLAELWTIRGALEDTNGDGFADSTRLAIELLDASDEAQVAAAANLTARLGFETMSIDLPLADSPEGPTVMIGSASPAAPPLAPDEAEPSGYVFVGADSATIHVWGDDDPALAAATLWLAGRAPHLWGAESLTLADAVVQIVTWAEENDLPIGDVSPTGIAVRGGGPGLETLFIEIEPAREAAGLATALGELDDGPELEGVREIAFMVRGPADTAFAHLPSPGGMPEPGGEVPGDGRKNLDLADLYTVSGLLGDSNGDEIPDRLDAIVTSTAVAATAVQGLTARLGLEAAGVRLPAAVTPDALDGAPGGTRVVIGTDHPALAGIIDDGDGQDHGEEEEDDERELPELPLDLGMGQVDVVREAFGDKAAILLRGADDDGVGAAVGYLAQTAPYLGRRGKDAPTLSTVRTDLRRFLARRTPAGQAAAAIDIGKLLLAELPGDASAVRLDITVDRAAEGLSAHLEAVLGTATETHLHDRDVQHAPEIWRLETELESEPDQLRRVIQEQREHAASGAAIAVQARISEPRAIRSALAAELETAIRAQGARTVEVEILPAYKQGFGWIEERVLPRLRGLAVDQIVIQYARNTPPADWPYQAMLTPTRWLLELFPIDEILAGELGVSLAAIRFEQVEPDGPTYRVNASANGQTVFEETFDPALVERPYFDTYPSYERVRVAAGWIQLAADGALILDEHLPTDLERVWDLYQSEVLPTLHDYTLRLHEGAPRAAYAPHFGELRARIALSEPDRPLGIDKERIAPMEALHEEIYFGTLHFFDLLGRIASGSPLAYPGRVIPIVESLDDGSAGRVEFVLSGFRSPVPRVEVSYASKAGQRASMRRDLPPLEVAAPTVRSLRLTSADEVESIGLWLKVDQHIEERTDLLRRHRERQVDGSWVTSERLQGALAELVAMRDAGIYSSELVYEGTPELAIAFGTQFAADDNDVTIRLPRNGMAAAAPNPADLVVTSGATHRVQWSTPMPPAEAHSILAVMAQEFDEASVYRLGESYLGKEIWGLDLMAPLPGTHWSQAKATAFKPTVVYSARQHANEVSSTSHVLRMAELLLTDEDWREALQRLNVVVHPMTNPDGAQLAFDLHQITPDHMLHAGYLGSLGVDVAAGSGDADPIYPETEVRELLWRTWLPDIFLNPHGYPSHEWVQPFSEYAGWVRHRTTQSRDWWGMRGWFMPSFQFLDDPEYPRHREHAFRIRDEITSAINALPDIADLNRRAYARYRRYGHDADSETFRLNFANDVLIYTALKGTRSGGSGWMSRNPKVTVWSGTTEAPDETAHGDWLELVASAGLAWDQAILRYLLALEHPVERTVTDFDGAVAIRLYRDRPGAQPDQPE